MFFFYEKKKQKKKGLVNFNEKLTPSGEMVLIFYLNDDKDSTCWFNGSSSLIHEEGWFYFPFYSVQDCRLLETSDRLSVMA